MYEITINGTVYGFNFGFGFLKEINKLVVQKDGGVERKNGFQVYLAEMLDGNAEALVTILNMANKGQDPRVTVQLLEEYLDDEDTDIEAVQNDVIDFLSKSNSTKLKTQKLMKFAEMMEL